jgi:hypothetical protein
LYRYTTVGATLSHQYVAAFLDAAAVPSRQVNLAKIHQNCPSAQVEHQSIC